MQRALTTLLLALSGAPGCAAGPGQPLPLEPGRAVSLKVGDSARTADGALHIGFEAVGADSRCPRGEQCVWAGDATVRLWLQRPGGARQRFELHTAAGLGQAAPEPGVRLLRLEPAPVSGRALAARDYTVTLMLDTGR